ncbi:MAG: hypothetical protein JXQ99_04485 [Hyphomicrobiaceae bacterium]
MIETSSINTRPLNHDLPHIPVLSCGPDFPMATLVAFTTEAHALISGATKGIPPSVLKLADRISRRWLIKSGNVHLTEIDAIAASLNQPGAHYLSVNYEWGCTVVVRAAGQYPELVRVLDWRTPGLGRYVVAADVDGASGRFITLTWPGYTGVLQAMAPNRFAAALNQAPMPRRGGGFLPLDWFANKVDVWRSKDVTPAHLLREVFEQADSFAEARRRLSETPIAAPAIFSLAGCSADDLCIIERTERAVHIHDGRRAAANAWQAPAWAGRARGSENAARVRQLSALPSSPTDNFDWLAPPVLNDTTRLAAIFRPSTGTLVAQGFAGLLPATNILSLQDAERHSGRVAPREFVEA